MPKLYLEKDWAPASFWHDIPLMAADGSYNFVTEIPMGTRAKMEVKKEQEWNPIAQDTNDDGSLLFYAGGSTVGVSEDGNNRFNYGMMPQAWENPAVTSAAGYGGDNDPLGVIEIGSSPLPRRSITPVKVLGSLGLIDDGENDSKVIVLRTSDPLAATIDGLDDMDPSVTARLVDWLKMYDFAADGVHTIDNSEKPYSAEDTIASIDEFHEQWEKLVDGETGADYGFSLPAEPEP